MSLFLSWFCLSFSFSVFFLVVYFLSVVGVCVCVCVCGVAGRSSADCLLYLSAL